jgi:hypothetical protein
MRAAALCALLAGCGGPEFHAQGTAVAPKADMQVEMSRTFAGNHPLDVQIDELPWPEHLGARHYAVWTIPRGATEAHLEGYLAYDHDARWGHLETTTPYNQLTVVVTAERARTPETPSDVVVARRTVDDRPA